MANASANATDFELGPNTLNTLRTSFESAARLSLNLFSLCQCRYPSVWLPELPRIYVPIVLEFCLHARRVSEIANVRTNKEIVSHRLKSLEHGEVHYVDKNYHSALNRIIHSKYLSLAYTQAADVEDGNELDQVVVAIEAESDRRVRGLVDLAGLALHFRNEIAPKVQLEASRLMVTGKAERLVS